MAAALTAPIIGSAKRRDLMNIVYGYLVARKRAVILAQDGTTEAGQEARVE